MNKFKEHFSHINSTSTKKIADVLRLIFWELTAGCNLKCIHCRAVASPERLKEELSTEECYRFIDHLITFANPILILTGGEPLFRSDIFDIAEYASKKSLRVGMATNGTMIDKIIAKKICDSGVKRVSISLDGSNARTHDSFRGIKGSFDKALKGYSNLKELGMSLQLNMTIAKHNMNEVEEVLKLALDLKADALHIFMLVPVGCGLQIADEQMIPPEDYERVLEWFFEQSIIHKNIELKATCAPHYFRIMRQKAKEKGIKIHANDHPHATRHGGLYASTKGCLAGSAVCFISRIGDVQPCGYLPVKAGNILKQPFREIWENSLVFQDLREPLNLKGKCGICEFKKLCEGCRARAFSLTGDYLEEEPYCIYQPKAVVADSSA